MASYLVKPTAKSGIAGLAKTVKRLFDELFYRVNGANIEAGHLYLNSAQLVGKTADPSSPSTGMVYFNSTAKQFRGYTGSDWIILGSLDGWLTTTLSATRTGNHTFTLPADVTSYVGKGTRVRYTDTTVKYGVVFSASFGAGVTTITLFTNTDYTMVANPTVLAFSNEMSPTGYPGWFNYDCTPSGWSGTPTQTISRFSVKGSTLFLTLSVTGTSNATTAILYSPNTMLPSSDIIQSIGYAINNGAVLTAVTQMIARNNNTTIDFYTDMASAAWTNSGTKRVDTTLAVQF